MKTKFAEFHFHALGCIRERLAGQDVGDVVIGTGDVPVVPPLALAANLRVDETLPRPTCAAV